MNAEFDYDLTQGQWDALKAIRVPTPNGRALNRSIVENLVALGLAEMTGGSLRAKAAACCCAARRDYGTWRPNVRPLEHGPEKHALELRPDGWKPVFRKIMLKQKDNARV